MQPVVVLDRRDRTTRCDEMNAPASRASFDIGSDVAMA
jgi:hypothetical protein